jgi:adenylyltransferase/sulfurtransferase
MIAMIQATEAIKVITGVGRSLVGRFLRYDALNMSIRELKLRKDPTCPICSAKPSITQLIDYEQFCGLKRGEGETAEAAREMTVQEYEAVRTAGTEHLLLDVREPFELGICQIEGNLNVPLGQLPQRLTELSAWKNKLVVSQCKSGRRSMKALETLRKHGFTQVVNLQGGILAWGQEIDPTVSPY